MYTIVGLGNPGTEYEHTRHNVGWIILGKIIANESLPPPTKSSMYSGLLSKGVFQNIEVSILFPVTFMNNSGVSVSKYLKDHGTLETLIVVHDDIDLPFGEVKISHDRGAGGHNGVKSIIDACGGKQFTRIRIGIAEKGFFGGIKRPVGEKLSHFVLSEFKSAEMKPLLDVTAKVAKALELIVVQGIEKAMQETNGQS